MGRDRTPPTIYFANLTAGQILTGTYKITANAADNRGIANVAFYVDGILKHTEVYSPYDFALDTTLYPIGNHTIKAKANDGSSNSTSVSVTVSFGVTAPTPTPTPTPTGVYDDFNNASYVITFDGAITPDGKWKSGYVSYGHASTIADSTGKHLELSPKLDMLRAARFDSTATRNNPHGKMTVTLDKQCTVNTQPWFTVWPLIGYVDETNHYYFNLKTNGWELGKKDNDLDPSLELQRYLDDGTAPKAVIGQKAIIEYWIVLGTAPNGVQCNHIRVDVNGAKVVDLWDDGTHSDGMGRINATGAKLKGAKHLSLYCEASQVGWDDILFTEATGVPA